MSGHCVTRHISLENLCFLPHKLPCVCEGLSREIDSEIGNSFAVLGILLVEIVNRLYQSHSEKNHN